MNEMQIEQAINQDESGYSNGLTETARQLVKPLHGVIQWFTESGYKAAAAGKKCPTQDKFVNFAANVLPAQDTQTVLCIADLFQRCYEEGYNTGRSEGQD